MNEERLYQVILAPHLTEKGTRLSDTDRQFVFEVLRSATKPDIKRAVEKMFKVEVESVQVVNSHGKTKRFGRSLGKQSNWKKAYVQLKPGHDINFVDGV